MTTSFSKERFDRYRKWFQSFLVTEFMELPVSEQERFVPLVEKFLEDCRKVADESRAVKERRISVVVTNIEENRATGRYEDKTLKFSAPRGIVKGDKVFHTLFSLDGETWYSSKRELITGR